MRFRIFWVKKINVIEFEIETFLIKTAKNKRKYEIKTHKIYIFIKSKRGKKHIARKVLVENI